MMSTVSVPTVHKILIAPVSGLVAHLRHFIHSLGRP